MGTYKIKFLLNDLNNYNNFLNTYFNKIEEYLNDLFYDDEREIKKSKEKSTYEEKYKINDDEIVLSINSNDNSYIKKIIKYNYYKNDDNIIIEFTLPGLSKKDLEVINEDNNINIKLINKNKDEKYDEKDNTIKDIIFKSNLSINITLPQKYLKELPKVKMENGILQIFLKEDKPAKDIKKIEIE